MVGVNALKFSFHLIGQRVNINFSSFGAPKIVSKFTITNTYESSDFFSTDYERCKHFSSRNKPTI